MRLGDEQDIAGKMTNAASYPSALKDTKTRKVHKVH